MKKRDRIYEKFGGKCAYCGIELDDTWQVDHKVSLHQYRCGIQGNPNSEDNLLPCCQVCNHYKREKGVESVGYRIGFREYMTTFHLRLGKLPKNTQVERTKKRIEYMWTIANRYNITPQQPFIGKFYMDGCRNSK